VRRGQLEAKSQGKRFAESATASCAGLPVFHRAAVLAGMWMVNAWQSRTRCSYAARAAEHGFTLCSTDGNCDTLGPWTDVIKEFGFVLPKQTIEAYPISDKMQMWRNHDWRRSAVQLKTAVLLLRENTTCSNMLSLTSPLAIRLQTTSRAFSKISFE
jgi:hypothetical protein